MWGRIVAIVLGALFAFGVVGGDELWVRTLGAVLTGLGIPFPWPHRALTERRDTLRIPTSRRKRGRITTLPPVLLLSVVLLAGCCAKSAVFRQYVAADRATYNEIAPAHEQYLLDDEAMSDEDLELWVLLLETWRARIEAARRLMEDE